MNLSLIRHKQKKSVSLEHEKDPKERLFFVIFAAAPRDAVMWQLAELQGGKRILAVELAQLVSYTL